MSELSLGRETMSESAIDMLEEIDVGRGSVGAHGEQLVKNKILLEKIPVISKAFQARSTRILVSSGACARTSLPLQVGSWME